MNKSLETPKEMQISEDLDNLFNTIEEKRDEEINKSSAKVKFPKGIYHSNRVLFGEDFGSDRIKNSMKGIKHLSKFNNRIDTHITRKKESSFKSTSINSPHHDILLNTLDKKKPRVSTINTTLRRSRIQLKTDHYQSQRVSNKPPPTPENKI